MLIEGLYSWTMNLRFSHFKIKYITITVDNLAWDMFMELEKIMFVLN